jgi:6-phosphogluconolactonase (cycloisomerase 2 family)
MKIRTLLSVLLVLGTSFQLYSACSLSTGVSYPVTAFPYGLSLSSNGLYLVVSTYESNRLVLFKVTDGKLDNGTQYTSSGEPYAIDFSPDGTHLATADYYSSSTTLYSVDSNGVLTGGTQYPLCKNQPASVTFSPNGSCLAFGCSNTTIVDTYVMNQNGILSGFSAADLPTDSCNPLSVAFSPNGMLLVTANYQSNDVTLFNVNLDCSLSNGIFLTLCLTARQTQAQPHFYQMGYTL